MINLVVGFERSGKTRTFQEKVKKDLKKKKKVRVVCLHGDVKGYKRLSSRAHVEQLVEDMASFQDVLQQYNNEPYLIVSTPSSVINELPLNSEDDLSFTFGKAEILSLLSHGIDSLYIDDAHVVLRNIVKSMDGIHGISGLLNDIQRVNIYKTDVHLACQVLSGLTNE